MSGDVTALTDAERREVYTYSVGWFGALCLTLLVLRKVLGVGKSASTSSSPSSRAASSSALSPDFLRFQRLYVVVYLVMMAADWLQGPYVYALYSAYGYGIGDIGVLFIVGFGSSMLFGTIVGSAADKYGRKKLCLVFALLYSLSCITKHFHQFEVLLVGRLLGGISTSILFSSFESWMVSEHHAARYPDEWLGLTFSACTTGNGIVAIASGVVASVVREQFGVTAPFDASLICLIVGGCLITLYWSENSGDSSIALSSTLGNAWTKLHSDNRIVLLGVIQSFFEGAMYIFVFMWTPALESTSPFANQVISHGWIFACFMICVLIGSSIFQHLIERNVSIERSSFFMLVTAAASLLVAAFFPIHSVRLAAFCVFEVCVGLFWPSVGFLRSRYVPEDCRATVMNFFRMPLNLIVVLVLLNIGRLEQRLVFCACVAVLLPPIVCQWKLCNIVKHAPSASSSDGGALYKTVATDDLSLDDVAYSPNESPLPDDEF